MIQAQNYSSEFPVLYASLSTVEKAVLIAKLFKNAHESGASHIMFIEYLALQIGNQAVISKKEIDVAVNKLEKLKVMHWGSSYAGNFNEKFVPVILQTIAATESFSKIRTIIEKRIYKPSGWEKTVYSFQLLYKWVTWDSMSVNEFRQLTPKLTLGQYCNFWATSNNGLLPAETWWKQQKPDKQAELLLIFFHKFSTGYEINHTIEDKAIAFISENKNNKEAYPFMYYYGISALLKGRLDQLKLSLNLMLPHHRMIHEAVLMCFDGNYEEALPHFEMGIAQWQKAEKIKYNPLSDIAGVLYGYTLLVNNVKDPFEVFNALSKKTNTLQTEYFKKLYKASDIEQCTAEFYYGAEENPQDFALLFIKWIGDFYGIPVKSKFPFKLWMEKEDGLLKNGIFWLAKELRNSGIYNPSTFLHEALRSNSILLLPKRESKSKTPLWEKWLTKLEFAIDDTTMTVDSTRLIWLIDPEAQQLNAVEQKVTKNGSWSKGKRISPYAIYVGEYTLTDPQDKRMKALVVDDPYGWGNRSDYFFLYDSGIAELAGRKNVYVAGDTNTPAEIRREAPRITLVRDKSNNYRLTYVPDYTTQIMINRVSFNVFEAYVQNKEQMKICEIINQMNGVFPPESHIRLFQWLNKIKEIVQLSGDIPSEVLGDVNSLFADPMLLIKVVPEGSEFKGEIHVQPIHGEQLLMQAGKGYGNFMHKLDSGLVNVQRDLGLESENLGTLYAVLDTHEVKYNPDDFSIYLSNEEQLLHFMEAMQDPSLDEIVRVEILKDQNNRVISFLKTSSINLHLNASANWLQMHAEDIQLDEGLILKFKDLLEFSRQGESNFLQLSNNEYIILSSKLKKRLQQMALLADFKGEEIIVHPLAALHLENLTDDMENVSKSKKWEKATSPFKEKESMTFPVSPELNGTLRNYQLDGYQWLCRRSEQGLGACLADDMGLGKTIQSIAVLLHRKDLGPALIVAPTSVCANWQSEIQLFAPSLRVFNIYEEDRQKLTQVLGAGDVLICSYGLVTNEKIRLHEIQFASLILDEAQAIKNPETKRSKAVWKLQSKAKWVTTGTPIENRLQELWSIFRFINPGLLGSLQQFRDRYVNPIENQNNEWVASQLKSLISPFLLRRTKAEVLTDLPPKTEINRFIIPGKEELAMYEAIRIKAKEDMASAQSLPPGQRQIKIFSVLTQLRLASCHPSLVDDSIVAASSKQEALLELLGEILPGGHQVLIFSQFVKHLSLIKAALDKVGIEYLYLDGSTTPSQRKKLIASFEGGKCQVFLLSLKAGGTGINLTAASYVIHMDPWWNPAVEDQATDRAHRIGQMKNVTVYRMIMKHTLEEKILELHSSKRALSDQIISDQSSGVLDLNQVMQLIMG